MDSFPSSILSFFQILNTKEAGVCTETACYLQRLPTYLPRYPRHPGNTLPDLNSLGLKDSGVRREKYLTHAPVFAYLANHQFSAAPV